MANLGHRGPEHIGRSIRFHRNRAWRTTGPASPVETRNIEPKPAPEQTLTPCRSCRFVSDCDSPTWCFEKNQPPANSPVCRTQELLDEDEAGCE